MLVNIMRPTEEGLRSLDENREDFAKSSGDGDIDRLALLERGVVALQAIARAIRIGGERVFESSIVDDGLSDPNAIDPLRRAGKSQKTDRARGQMYSAEEAAELLRFNIQTVRRHLRNRKLGGVRDNSGRWWVPQAEIDAFLTAKRRIDGP